MSQNAGPGSVTVPKAQEWAAFDALPEQLRNALSLAPLKFSARDLLSVWREHGEDVALTILSQATQRQASQNPRKEATDDNPV